MKVILALAKIVSLAGMVIASIVLLGTVGSLELNILTHNEAITRSAIAFTLGLIAIVTAVIVDRLEVLNNEN